MEWKAFAKTGVMLIIGHDSPYPSRAREVFFKKRALSALSAW